MNNFRTSLCLSAGLFALSTGSPSGARAPARPVSAAQDAIAPWSFAFKKGDVQKFRTYFRLKARNTDDTEDVLITVVSQSKHEIKDVTADGIVTWEQVDEKSAAMFNGKPVEPGAEAPKPITVTFAKDGMYQKWSNPIADPYDPAEKSRWVPQIMPVPTASVKAGDSWKTEFKNPVLKNRTITATSTLVGTEKVLGVDALRINIAIDYPTAFGSDPNDVEVIRGTYFLDARTHELIRSHYVVKNPLTPFPLKKAEVHVLVNRILPGQNETADPDGEKVLKGESLEKAKG